MNIESCIREMPTRITSLTSTTLRGVRTELSNLRGALENITHCVSSVTEHKNELLVHIDQLLTNIEAREQAANDKLMVPVSHNCGGLGCTSLLKTEFDEIISDHHFETPVDCCDELAQVTIFIGVLCSIILSVS